MTFAMVPPELMDPNWRANRIKAKCRELAESLSVMHGSTCDQSPALVAVFSRSPASEAIRISIDRQLTRLRADPDCGVGPIMDLAGDLILLAIAMEKEADETRQVECAKRG